MPWAVPAVALLVALLAWLGLQPRINPPRPEFDALVYSKWLPLMGEPGYYTERGRRFDSVVKHLSGGDVPFRLEGLAQRYVQDLNPRDPGPAHAREFARHSDTRHISYDIDPGLASTRKPSIARFRASFPNQAPGHTTPILFSRS
jgi:hypothetical protein